MEQKIIGNSKKAKEKSIKSNIFQHDFKQQQQFQRISRILSKTKRG